MSRDAPSLLPCGWYLKSGYYVSLFSFLSLNVLFICEFRSSRRRSSHVRLAASRSEWKTYYRSTCSSTRLDLTAMNAQDRSLARTNFGHIVLTCMPFVSFHILPMFHFLVFQTIANFSFYRPPGEAVSLRTMPKIVWPTS